MRRSRVARLFFLHAVAAFAGDLSAQPPAPESPALQRVNQVFAKVVVPIKADTPQQGRPIVESWIVEQLKELGEPDCIAVTDWVPVRDMLLSGDDGVIWDGILDGKHAYCPPYGDIRSRKDGRVTVLCDGWGGSFRVAPFTLVDEPGSRAIGPVQRWKGPGRFEAVEDSPYVAVLIAPPSENSVASGEEDSEAEPGVGADSR